MGKTARTNKMSIVRVAKKDQPFTMIANTTLQDTTISLDAKGVLVWLISKPEDWTVYKKHLQKTFSIGRERMDRIFDELEEARYVRSRRLRMPDGTFQWEWVVHEIPFTEQPLSAYPAPAEPATANPTSTKKDLTKDRHTKEAAGQKADDALNPICQELLEQIDAGIVANGFKAPTARREQLAAIDRMLRIDGKTADEIRTMIEWSMSHDFWAANIRSAVKLRKHYETMAAQAVRDAKRPQEPADGSDAARAVEMTAERLRRQAEEMAQAVPMPTDLRLKRRR
jgi:hypothetical protein